MIIIKLKDALRKSVKVRKKKVDEEKAQLVQYANDPYVQRTKANTELKKLVLVWHGWELLRMDEVN